MRRALLVLVTSLLITTMAAPAQAASSYKPGDYRAGPKGGDTNTIAEADPSTGTVRILQHNTRQAAAVHCIGDGPRATLLATHTVSDSVSSVEVSYTEATTSEHPVIDVLVTGSSGRWFGHAVSHGPKANESGSIKVPLAEAPDPGEVLTVQFGLQVHAGCLPHPTMLGLTGSRLVEGGQATFSSVQVG